MTAQVSQLNHYALTSFVIKSVSFSERFQSLFNQESVTLNSDWCYALVYYQESNFRSETHDAQIKVVYKWLAAVCFKTLYAFKLKEVYESVKDEDLILFLNRLNSSESGPINDCSCLLNNFIFVTLLFIFSRLKWIVWVFRKGNKAEWYLLSHSILTHNFPFTSFCFSQRKYDPCSSLAVCVLWSNCAIRKHWSVMFSNTPAVLKCSLRTGCSCGTKIAKVKIITRTCSYLS